MAVRLRQSGREVADGGSRDGAGDPRTAALAAELRRELRGEVGSDPYSRHLFASDASMYAIEPLAVCFPRDADDVAAAVAVAGRFEVPVVTRGAGTSLSGQTVGGRGIVVDTSRHMNAIHDIDVEARRVRAVSYTHLTLPTILLV